MRYGKFRIRSSSVSRRRISRPLPSSLISTSAIGARIVHQHQVIFLHVGKRAVLGQNIAGLADIAHHGIGMDFCLGPGRPGFDLVIGLIKHGADQGIKAQIRAAVETAGIFLDGLHRSHEDAALGADIAAGLDLEKDILSIGSGKGIKDFIQGFSQLFKVQAGLGRCVIGHAEAAAQVDKIKIREIFGDIQQGVDALQVDFLLQEEGADVLI